MGQEPALPSLGLCPLCNRSLETGSLVVTYADREARPRMLAECPDCDEAVVPV